MTNDVEDLEQELEELESAISEGGQGAADHVKLRERHAFVAAKLADLERAAPYADKDTEALLAEREQGELQREDMRIELDTAIANRGPRSALARKLQAELAAIDERENSPRIELSTREMQDVNAELATHRATVVAERELEAEDEAALEGLETWRRGKAEEALRDSFDDRLAQRVEPTKDRLIEEAEAKIGTRLIFGPNAPDGDAPVARPLTELLAEAEAQQTGEVIEE